MASSGGPDVKRRKAQLSTAEETPEERQLQRDMEHLGLLLVRVCISINKIQNTPSARADI